MGYPLFINIDSGSVANSLVRGSGSQASGTASPPEIVLGDKRELDFYFVDASGSYADFSGDNAYSLAIAISFPGGIKSRPSGGDFTLTLGGDTTSALPYNISASDLEDELNGLASVISAGLLDVTGPEGGPFIITFRTTGDKGAFSADASNLEPRSQVYATTTVEGDGSTQEAVVLQLRRTVAAYQNSFTVITDDDSNPIGWSGELNASTEGLVELLAGNDTVNAFFEIEVTAPNGKPRTYGQYKCTIRNQIIDPGTVSGPVLEILLTQSEADARYLQIANNLSDLDDASDARTNLGLGSAATQDSSAFATAAQGALAGTAVQPGNLATETTTGLVQFATQAEVWEASNVDAVARAKHLLIKRGSSENVSIASGNATGDWSLAIGKNADAGGVSSIAIGGGDDFYDKHAKAMGNGSLAIGVEASASGIHSQAIGSASSATGEYSLAYGEYAHSLGIYSVALGREAKASRQSSIAIGNGASDGGSGGTGFYSIAIGDTAEAGADSAIAIGYMSSNNSSMGVALGAYASISSGSGASGQMAIGPGATVNCPTGGLYSMAVGPDSAATTTSSTVPGRCYAAVGPSAKVHDYTTTGSIDVLEVAIGQQVSSRSGIRARSNGQVSVSFKDSDVAPIDNGSNTAGVTDADSLERETYAMRVDTTGSDPVAYIDFNVNGVIYSVNLATLT